MILGITGGTGCGKTTLLRALEDCGFLVLDCDAVYHRLLETDAALLQAIDRRFPGTVEGSTLQRKKLGSIVFSDKAALQDLNRITHRSVKQELLRQLEGRQGHAAIDAIALFEGGLGELCDMTVAVTAPEEVRIQRLMDREGISEAYARRRIAAQHGNEWFSARCDHTLENCGSLEDFQAKCLAFIRSIGIITL